MAAGSGYAVSSAGGARRALTGGAVYALRDECTYESVPLSDGDVAGGAIECW